MTPKTPCNYGRHEMLSSSCTQCNVSQLVTHVEDVVAMLNERSTLIELNCYDVITIKTLVAMVVAVVVRKSSDDRQTINERRLFAACMFSYIHTPSRLLLMLR